MSKNTKEFQIKIKFRLLKETKSDLYVKEIRSLWPEKVIIMLEIELQTRFDSKLLYKGW